MTGDYEGALEAFKQAVFLQPDFAEGYRCIGLVQFEMGREDEALRAFQEAIRLAPDLAVAYVNMAVVLGRLGRPAEGLQAYREGVRLAPPLARATTGLEQYLMNSQSGRSLTRRSDCTSRIIRCSLPLAVIGSFTIEAAKTSPSAESTSEGDASIRLSRLLNSCRSRQNSRIWIGYNSTSNGHIGPKRVTLGLRSSM
jgi:tetratricopeptide (TPR) repeat protein